MLHEKKEDSEICNINKNRICKITTTLLKIETCSRQNGMWEKEGGNLKQERERWKGERGRDLRGRREIDKFEMAMTLVDS